MIPLKQLIHRPNLASIAAALAVFTCSMSGQAQESIKWRTGPDFHRQLKEACGVQWSKKPLREALTSLSQTHQLAFMLDRRIDPHQMISNPDRNLSVDIALRGLAGQLKIGVSYVGPVIYIGPASATKKLATLAAHRKEDIRKLPDSIQSQLARIRPWHWEDLAEPKKLIEQLAAEVGVKVVGLDQIPHDLWPAVGLPPLSFTERMTLVSAGFGLTFEFSGDGTAIRFVPIPDEVALERSYPVSADIGSRAAKLSKMFPDATIRSDGRTLSVVALLEDHNSIRDLLDGKSVSRPTVIGTTRRTDVKIESLNVENKPVGAVIKYLGQQLKIEVEFDPATKSKLDELVSFTVKDATQQQVFKAALDPVGLSFRLRDGKLTVLPGKP